jgi:hypothetical protein
MQVEIKQRLDQIASLPPDWHLAGTMSGIVLRAIAAQTEKLGLIQHSAETGSGKTTLLFSHLSANHQVFALDCGDSISRVKNSQLFNSSNVTIIEGPSQMTLPRHVFEEKLQLVLIDGPHGYPFPDLEYYYFYPHIAVGGLLLIDDINIPSIKSMFEIVRAGDMFELVEVVEYTAFLRRTEAPSDSWWLQGVNRAHYEYAMVPPSRSRLLTRLVPPQLKRLVPQSWKKKLLEPWVRRKKEQAAKRLDGLTYLVLCKLTDDGIPDPDAVSKKVAAAFATFPNWQRSEAELREVRKRVIFALSAQQEDMQKVTATVESLFKLLQKSFRP